MKKKHLINYLAKIGVSHKDFMSDIGMHAKSLTNYKNEDDIPEKTMMKVLQHHLDGIGVHIRFLCSIIQSETSTDQSIQAFSVVLELLQILMLADSKEFSEQITKVYECINSLSNTQMKKEMHHKLFYTENIIKD
jgi:hypothetical protein